MFLSDDCIPIIDANMEGADSNMGTQSDDGTDVAICMDAEHDSGRARLLVFFNAGRPLATNEVRPNMGGVSDNIAWSDGGVNVTKRVNFRALVNKERVKNADTILPMLAIEKVKIRFREFPCWFFVGKIVAFTIVQNYVKNMWAKFGLQKLMKNDDGVFLFKFASKDVLERVLERGPWIIRNTPLIH
ncbi:retrovirus-related pol polyprotein from transposon TNT 1-94 [Tanacetum coccineum]